MCVSFFLFDLLSFLMNFELCHSMEKFEFLIYGLTYLQSLEKGKKRSNEKEQDKQEEVIHVRAKRGQATDSHSLAERVYIFACY